MKIRFLRKRSDYGRRQQSRKRTALKVWASHLQKDSKKRSYFSHLSSVNKTPLIDLKINSIA